MEIELEELRAKRDTMQHWETQVSDVSTYRRDTVTPEFLAPVSLIVV